ncbi:MAG: hypothetical protein H0U74_17675 [Bradymonadaceae bacterium]|nr:hypothetical protein [Lujinxingiaceae bacterium]
MSDSQNSIHKVANLLGYFRNELISAFQKLGLTTSEETQAYLAHLLQGFSRLDGQLSEEVGFHKPAAMLLGEAMNSMGERRIEAYRRLGDVSLFSCGFFGQHLARTPVSPGYYQAVGRTAYGRLGEIMEYKQPGGSFNVIFTELATKFDAIVEAFGQMGKMPDTSDPLYDDLLSRWQRGEKVDVQALLHLGVLPARHGGDA